CVGRRWGSTCFDYQWLAPNTPRRYVNKAHRATFDLLPLLKPMRSFSSSSQLAHSVVYFLMGEAGEEMVRNKQVVLKEFVVGAPKETDMEIRQGKASLRAPTGAEGAIVVKNLYLSCDPYMRGRMRDYYDSYIPPFQPGSV
ncbi:hypothetical protein GW17_00001522, partial [Ensete ventricosum]